MLGCENFIVRNTLAYYAKVFVVGKHLQPSLIFL